MNKMRLNQLFSNYIEKFEYINNPDNNETYKWAAVEQYRESFNLEAPDLPGMLYEAWKASENLIDSANQQPFYALVSYAKEEPETVRKMFRDLFADDGENLFDAGQHRGRRGGPGRSKPLRLLNFPDGKHKSLYHSDTGFYRLH